MIVIGASNYHINLTDASITLNNVLFDCDHYVYDAALDHGRWYHCAGLQYNRYTIIVSMYFKHGGEIVDQWSETSRSSKDIKLMNRHRFTEMTTSTSTH